MLTPVGYFFANKNARHLEELRKIGSIPSGYCQMFAVVVMLVVVLGVGAQKLLLCFLCLLFFRRCCLDRHRGSCGVCVCCVFRKIPTGTFPSGVFFIYFQRFPPTFELPPG